MFWRVGFACTILASCLALEAIYGVNDDPLDAVLDINGVVVDVDIPPVDRSRFAEAPRRDPSCNLEVFGSRVREDYQIKGLYEHLNGVVFGDRPTYWNSKQKLFLFYLVPFSCWAIGTKAGDEEGLASYVSDEADHPADVKSKWQTALSGEWTVDSKVYIGCEGRTAKKEGRTFQREASKDQYWKERVAKSDEEDPEQIPSGYELKRGFLAARDDCDMKSIKIDHHSALAHCWYTQACAGITYQSKKVVPHKPLQIWYKSCIEFHPSKDWITLVKTDGDFKAKQIKVEFRNSFSDDVILFLKTPSEESDDEKWGMLRPDESFGLDVDMGSEWYAEYENGTSLHNHLITGSGGPDGTGIYTFCPENVINREAELAKEKYFEENGRVWLQVWPRSPPIHPIWDPVEIGHIRTATTTHHHWHLGDPEDYSLISVDGDKEKPPLDIRMETRSIVPKVFAFEGALSHDECDFIRNLTEGKFKRSKILADQTHEDYDPNEDMVETVSKVRTSTQTWLSSNSSGVIKNIFYRIGDLLQLDNNKLNNESISESLQVLHYAETQQYKPHHDYMEPYFFPDQTNIQRGYNRFATILFYLHPADEGGGTGFPIAKEGDLKVELPKGSAVLFYSMLEDGNLDHYSQHAGLPVIKGTKYAANLWIWDPMWGGHL